jgi:hypothetical protein
MRLILFSIISWINPPAIKPDLLPTHPNNGCVSNGRAVDDQTFIAIA